MKVQFVAVLVFLAASCRCDGDVAAPLDASVDVPAPRDVREVDGFSRFCESVGTEVGDWKIDSRILQIYADGGAVAPILVGMRDAAEGRNRLCAIDEVERYGGVLEFDSDLGNFFLASAPREAVVQVAARRDVLNVSLQASEGKP